MKRSPKDKYMNARVYCYVDGLYFIRSLKYIDNAFNLLRSDFPPSVVVNIAQEAIDIMYQVNIPHCDWRRAHWFGSFSGSNAEFDSFRRYVKDKNFDPFVFKKPKAGPEKQVDTQLVTKLLTDSFMGLFDLAIVVSGDSDYLNAIKEVRSNGKDVIVMAFQENCNLDLIYEADIYCNLKMLMSPSQGIGNIEHLLEKLKKEAEKNNRYTKKS